MIRAFPFIVFAALTGCASEEYLQLRLSRIQPNAEAVFNVDLLAQGGGVIRLRLSAGTLVVHGVDTTNGDLVVSNEGEPERCFALNSPSHLRLVHLTVVAPSDVQVQLLADYYHGIGPAHCDGGLPVVPDRAERVLLPTGDAGTFLWRGDAGDSANEDGGVVEVDGGDAGPAGRPDAATGAST